MAQIYSQDPNLLSFIPILREKALLCQYDAIEDSIDEVIKLKVKINRMFNFLEAAEKPGFEDPHFTSKFEAFFEENAEKVLNLEEEAVSVKKSYFETFLFLGHNKRKLGKQKSDKILVSYIRSFEAIFQIHKRLEKEL